MDIWIVSMFWLLWIKLLGTFLGKYFIGHLLIFSLYKQTPRGRTFGLLVMILKWFFKVFEAVYVSISNIEEFRLFHMQQHLVLSVFKILVTLWVWNGIQK